MRPILFSAFILGISAACVLQNSHGLTDSALTPGGGPPPALSPSGLQTLFTHPDCLPNCTAADKDRIVDTGYVENIIIGAIEQANETIDFSMYTFSRKPIYEALERALARNVKIRGIVDKGLFNNLKEFCNHQGCQLPEPYSTPEYLGRPLADRKALVSNDPLFRQASLPEKLQLLGYRLPGDPIIQQPPGARRLVHNKLVLVDNRYLVSGSGNWSSTAVTINLENLVRVDGAIRPDLVSSYRCMLDLIWGGDGGRIANELPGCETVESHFAPFNGRFGEGPANRILRAVSETTGPIKLVMHHLTHPALVASLVSSAQAGRSIQVLFDDDDCNFPQPELATLVSTPNVEFRYMPTACNLNQLSHNKFGIFGEGLVINGSGNWSISGLGKNYENFLVLTGDQGVAPYHEFFQRAWQMAVPRSVCQCDSTEVACRERFCMDRSR